MKVELPEKVQCLFGKSRYVVLYGGRGGGKSHSIATALLIRGAEKPLRILCTREFQVSIKDSVHQLLRDKIIQMGLESFYEVKNNEIVGKNGTRFGFIGLRHNISNVKSWEGADVAWVEEAHVVSKSSWDILIPTIRKEDSQIIVSLNPELDTDETYQRFIVSPPPDSQVVKINWNDNPWFPDVLRKEKDHLLQKDPVAYENVWEGLCKQTIEGAIFARQIEKATVDGRINDEVEYNNSVPVHTYWDLGKANKTAIWFAQYVGMQWRILHCIVGFGKDLEDYIAEIQSLPYGYGTHYLPHDARQDRLGMQRSVEDQVRQALGNVEIVERVTHKINAIEAAKEIMQLCHFHKTNCADGLYNMRRYAYKVREDGTVSQEPDHQYSDAPDAFMTFAMSAQPDRQEHDLPSFKSYAPRLG
jgi:phage terminase large subunit